MYELMTFRHALKAKERLGDHYAGLCMASSRLDSASPISTYFSKNDTVDDKLHVLSFQLLKRRVRDPKESGSSLR